MLRDMRGVERKGCGACIAIVASLFTACASSPPAELPPVRVPSMQEFMGVGFPLEAGPYSAMNVQRYLDPQLGIRVGYVAFKSGDRVDIYVYPAASTRGQSEMPVGADSAVSVEFKKARAELHTEVFERRGATGIRSVADTTIQMEFSADTLRGMWSDFEISRDDEIYMSSIAVFLKEGSFVKVRHSVAPDKFAASSETMVDLIREFLRSVRP